MNPLAIAARNWRKLVFVAAFLATCAVITFGVWAVEGTVRW